MPPSRAGSKMFGISAESHSSSCASGTVRSRRRSRRSRTPISSTAHRRSSERASSRSAGKSSRIPHCGTDGSSSRVRSVSYHPRRRRRLLSQSPQRDKQMLMSTGLDRVYEIAPDFRAEQSDTVRHVTEFTSFDGEVSWIERQEDFFPILEGAVDAAIERVRAECKAELALLEVDPKRPALPLKRLAYPEALELLRNRGKRLRDGDDIDTEGEKLLGQAMGEEGRELYFVTEYPTSIKPFYVMAKPDEPEYSCAFNLEYKGDEMASGGQREHRYDVLLARMKEKGLNPENFDFYLKAFRYGMPPHGGWGFGLDRFIQKLLDLPNIREAILFPHDRVRLVPWGFNRSREAFCSGPTAGLSSPLSSRAR